MNANADAWELYAQSYDRILPVLPFYQDAVDRHVQALKESGAELILDAGAGTGNVTIKLLELGISVVALDSSPPMLQRLEAKLKNANIKNAVVQNENVECLKQFKDNSFGAINLLLALYAMDRPRDALHELIRVLRTGGAIVLTEPCKEFNLQVLIDFVEEFLNTSHTRQSLLTDWERVLRANLVLDPSKRQQRLSVEEISELLSAQGFSIINSQESHLGNCSTITAIKQ